jgi:hypothetical protein
METVKTIVIAGLKISYDIPEPPHVKKATLYLNVPKELLDAISEDEIIKLISIIEKKTFFYTAYLNIDAEQSKQPVPLFKRVIEFAKLFKP